MVRYNGKLYDSESWDAVKQEILARYAKKKYYEWEYSYNRYNPQLGTSERTSTVIASTESQARNLADKRCRAYRTYGSLSFIGLTGNKKLLKLNEDYRIVFERNENQSNFGITAYKVGVEEIYHC